MKAEHSRQTAKVNNDKKDKVRLWKDSILTDSLPDYLDVTTYARLNILSESTHEYIRSETDLLFQSKHVCNRRALFEDTQHIDLIHDHVQRMSTTTGKHKGKWTDNGEIIDHRNFPFNRKIRKSQNGSKIHKILGKSSRKSENFHISEIWTIQPKIPGRKSNGTDIPGNKFPKSWVYRHFVRLSYFWEILESHSSLEIPYFSPWTRFFGRMENNYVRWVHLTTPKSLGDSEKFNLFHLH